MSHIAGETESKTGITFYNPYTIVVNVLQEDFTYLKHAVQVNDSMTIASLKQLFFKFFDTKSFNMQFAEVNYNSSENDIDHKFISYFLFKDASLIELYRYDVEYIMPIMKKFPSLPSKPHPEIHPKMWRSAHVIAYSVDKPVPVKSDNEFVYIITSNGKKYEGPIQSVMSQFFDDGFDLYSLATPKEITDNFLTILDCFYNFM